MAKEFTKNLTTVTTPQAAEMLGVTPQCVRAMVTDGRLSGVQPKVRAHMQIDLAAVQELQAQRQRTAASKLEQQAERTRKAEPPRVQADLSRLAGAGRLVRIEQRLTEIEAVLEQLAEVWEL